MAVTRVLIMKPADPDAPDFLQNLSMSFSEERREEVRFHVAKEHRTAYVWFDDELPPDLFCEILESRMEQS